jgi:hypothetical protein
MTAAKAVLPLRLNFLCLLLLLLGASLNAAPTTGPSAVLLSNGDFQTESNGVPEGWPAAKDGVGYATEGANRYLRLVSSKPDEMVMTYRQVRIPASVKAIEMSWKQRTTGLKAGKQAWFDARILLQWKDAAGEKVPGVPSAAATHSKT